MAVQEIQKRQISGARTYCWFWAERNVGSAFTLYDSFTYWESKLKLCADPSAFKDTTGTSVTEYSCTFAWLPIFVNPKGYCWNGLSKSLNISLRNQSLETTTCILPSILTLQMFCNNIFPEDKNMTHFTFQSKQQKRNILDSFSKHTYLIFMFSVLLLFCFCSYLETEIRSLLSAHPDFDPGPY